MKKLFAVGATAALLMAATSPASALTLAIDDGDDVEYNAIAQNISGGFGDVDQSQGFTFVQFNSALNDF